MMTATGKLVLRSMGYPFKVTTNGGKFFVALHGAINIFDTLPEAVKYGMSKIEGGSIEYIAQGLSRDDDWRCRGRGCGLVNQGHFSQFNF